eukprot:TRINITY_DN3564_c0_g3_i1.p1 TRINITY_DN3564_c0_g3~~TRINITY_DN3564_c0_g3_i1.p1  ORF type:complete len:659 (-),score=161.13 TRINITY_DN3564_c0_g3_i1:165-2141(-)
MLIKKLSVGFVLLVLAVVVVLGEGNKPLWGQPNFDSRHTSYTPFTSLTSGSSLNSTFPYYEVQWQSTQFSPVTSPIVTSSGHILLLTANVINNNNNNISISDQQYHQINLTCVEPVHGKTVYSVPIDLSFIKNNNSTSIESNLLSLNYTHYFELKLSPAGNTLYFSLTIHTNQATYYNVLTFYSTSIIPPQYLRNINSNDNEYDEDYDESDDSEESEESDSYTPPTPIPYYKLSQNSTISNIIDVLGIYPSYGVLTPLSDSSFLLTRTYSFSLYSHSSLLSSYSLYSNSSSSSLFITSLLYNTAVAFPMNKNNISELNDISIYGVYINETTQIVVKTVVTQSGNKIEYYWSHETILSPKLDAKIIVDPLENIYIFYQSVLIPNTTINDQLMKLDKYKSVIFDLPFKTEHKQNNQQEEAKEKEGTASMGLDWGRGRLVLRRRNNYYEFNASTGEFLWVNILPRESSSDSNGSKLTRMILGMSIDSIGNIFSLNLIQKQTKQYYGITLLNPTIGTIVFNQSLILLSNTNNNDLILNNNDIKANRNNRGGIVIADKTIYFINENNLIAISGSYKSSNSSIVVSSSDSSNSDSHKTSSEDGGVPRTDRRWVIAIVVVAGILTVVAIAVAIALVMYFKRDSVIRNPQYYRLDTDEILSLNNEH